MSDEIMVKVENATFSYGKKPVWENISLEVKRGECLSLLGPNGCGKTTLLNCISGSNPLTSGSIQLLGKEVSAYDVGEKAKRLGYVFQEHSAPFPYTSIEVVRMGRTPHLGLFGSPDEKDTELAYKIMEDLGIAHLAGESYTQISGGERQLVLIARTLCQQPDILLLDEPTSHLDFKNQALVLRNVKKLSDAGMTIIMTSHFPNHVWHVGDRVIMMGYSGIIADGKVDDVMTEENLSKTYGVPVRIFEGKSGDKENKFCDPDLD